MNEFTIGVFMGIAVAVPFLTSRKWAATFLLNLLIALVIYGLVAGPEAICTLAEAYATFVQLHNGAAVGFAIGILTAGLLKSIFVVCRE